MVIRTDGSVRTSSWNFHRRETPQPAVAHFQAAVLNNRHAILAAIRKTSDRHVHNRSLQHADLSPADWHNLFQALIEAESGYDPGALSPKGAYGLGQLMPATARSLGVDRTDPHKNLEGAARYLLAQLAEFRDVDLALAAYNAGPHRVREHGGVPPFSETRAYIARIHRIRARLSRPMPAQPISHASIQGTPRAPVLIDLKAGRVPFPNQEGPQSSRSETTAWPTRPQIQQPD